MNEKYKLLSQKMMYYNRFSTDTFTKVTNECLKQKPDGVVIVPSKAEYGMLLDILNAQGAETTKAQRRQFATRAFGVSSHYDTAIHSWFEK